MASSGQHMLGTLCWSVLAVHLTVAATLPEEFHHSSYKHSWGEIWGVHGISLLRRQIRSDNGHVAVTLVFRASKPVSIRWYRVQPPTTRLPKAVVHNGLPIEDCANYTMHEIRSYDVTATTLEIIGVTKDDYPLDFETFFVTDDEMFQVQVRTVIKPPLRFQNTLILSPEWLRVPIFRSGLSEGNSPAAVCEVRVPYRNDGKRAELTMLRRRVTNLSKKGFNVTDERIGFVDASVRNRTKSDFARRHKVTAEFSSEVYQYFTYRVRVRLRKISEEEIGSYICFLEDNSTKMFTAATLNIRGVKRHRPPLVDFVACDSDSNNRIVSLRSGQKSCVRCRAVGNPRPQISLHNYGYAKVNGSFPDISTIPRFGVTRVNYTNIADLLRYGATYIFHNPQARHTGSYFCRASNRYGKKEVKFDVQFAK